MKVLYTDEKVIVIERQHNYREYGILQEADSTFMPADEKNLIDYLEMKGFNTAATSIKGKAISESEKIANMKVYDFMKSKGIGDFVKGSTEEDIEYFLWYMQEAENLHNLVSALAVTDSQELAELIKHLQDEVGENTDWYNRY